MSLGRHVDNKLGLGLLQQSRRHLRIQALCPTLPAAISIPFYGYCNEEKYVAELGQWINHIHSWGINEYAEAVHKDVKVVNHQNYRPLGSAGFGLADDKGSHDVLADQTPNQWQDEQLRKGTYWQN
jgi:hypothetical protein